MSDVELYVNEDGERRYRTDLSQISTSELRHELGRRGGVGEIYVEADELVYIHYTNGLQSEDYGPMWILKISE